MNQDCIDPAELPPSVLSPFINMVYIIQKAKVHMDKKKWGLDNAVFNKNSDLIMCVCAVFSVFPTASNRSFKTGRLLHIVLTPV